MFSTLFPEIIAPSDVTNRGFGNDRFPETIEGGDSVIDTFCSIDKIFFYLLSFGDCTPLAKSLTNLFDLGLPDVHLKKAPIVF